MKKEYPKIGDDCSLYDKGGSLIDRVIITQKILDSDCYNHGTGKIIIHKKQKKNEKQ